MNGLLNHRQSEAALDINIAVIPARTDNWEVSLMLYATNCDIFECCRCLLDGIQLNDSRRNFDMLAMYLLSPGNYQRSIQFYAKATKLDAKFAKTRGYFCKGKALHNAGQYDMALDALKAAVRANKHDHTLDQLTLEQAKQIIQDISNTLKINNIIKDDSIFDHDTSTTTDTTANKDGEAEAAPAEKSPSRNKVKKRTKSGVNNDPNSDWHSKFVEMEKENALLKNKLSQMETDLEKYKQSSGDRAFLEKELNRLQQQLRANNSMPAFGGRGYGGFGAHSAHSGRRGYDHDDGILSFLLEVKEFENRVGYEKEKSIVCLYICERYTWGSKQLQRSKL